MKLSFLLCLTAVVLVSATPWNPRPGRGIFRREAVAEPEPFHRRPGGAVYRRTAEAEAEPEAADAELKPGFNSHFPESKREANLKPGYGSHFPETKRDPEPFHRRPGGAVYRREANPKPEADPEAKPWNPRPGRGIF